VSCAKTRVAFSALRDGDLSRDETRRVGEHLEACAACAREWSAYAGTLDALGDLPELSPVERVLGRVLDRIEVESRGPGLALLFRPVWAARPLMLPSLLHASLIVAALLTSALAVDAWSVRRQRDARLAAEAVRTSQLLFGGPLRKVHTTEALADRLSSAGPGDVFVETVIGADGTVLDVRLIEGDRKRAQPVMDALREERFEPTAVPERGPAAVSIYQLISYSDVLGDAPPSDL
jgi:Putative zinc-finger